MEHFINQPQISPMDDDTQYQQAAQDPGLMQQDMDALQAGASQRLMPSSVNLPLFTAPRPLSEAQASMLPVIEGICDEAEAKCNADTDPNWENLEALGIALKRTDVDGTTPLANPDPEALEKTRPAKLGAVEMLYDHAKQMSKKEFASYLYYLSRVVRGTGAWLLDGDMGEGYWAMPWLHDLAYETALHGYGDNEDEDAEHGEAGQPKHDSNAMDETMNE
jgi:hypothetical protein